VQTLKYFLREAKNKSQALKTLQDKKSDALAKLGAIDTLKSLKVSDGEINRALRKAGIKNADELLK